MPDAHLQKPQTSSGWALARVVLAHSALANRQERLKKLHSLLISSTIPWFYV